MAPDDDGHAGKLGGGNQHEIGIEIEGVGDLHVMMAEISGEIEPSPQRLQSEETAAEGELSGVREVVGERATAADAAEMGLKLRMGEILGEDSELALGSSRFKSIDHEKQADRGSRKPGRIGVRSCGQAGRFRWRAPDHPPTGAEASAAVELGAWRRESATTGRENSPA